jgi:hypothetical protein
VPLAEARREDGAESTRRRDSLPVLAYRAKENSPCLGFVPISADRAHHPEPYLDTLRERHP